MSQFIPNPDEIRQQLIHLRRQLLNFPTEDSIQPILWEQEKLAKLRREQLRNLADTKCEALKIARLIHMRQTARTSNKAARDLKERVEKRRKRLEKLKRLNAPSFIIANEVRMLWEVTASLDEIIGKHAQKQQLVAHAQEELDETIAAIAAQHEKYRLAKKELQAVIANTEKQLHTMNRNLTPSLPHCHLSIVAPGNDNGHRPALSKRRRKQLHLTTDMCVDKTQTVSNDQWSLVFTESEYEVGMSLPTTRLAFANALRQILNERESKLDTALVHDKLQAIINMTLQQRQSITKQHNEDWKGWKIARASKRYRLFLDIDEVKLIIRFTIVCRKCAYGYH